MNAGRPPGLDKTDWCLLEELQSDSKRSLKEIGAAVGLSAPAVMERVRKLESAGVIKGYQAVLDARAVGLDVSAFIGVSITTPGRLGAFEQEIDTIPQVMECHHVTGGHTVLLKVKTRNTAGLEQLISRVRSMDGVVSTETMVVLSTRTERAQVALPTSEADEETAPKKRPRRKAS
jgi:Lrp/AsnC family leucine-responsive transcriptional regulator